MKKALLIKTDGTIEIIDKEWNLDDLQEAVGGLIESIPQPFETTSFFGNDEAKFSGPEGNALSLNMVATLICRSRLSNDDIICGDVIVIGYNQSSGESESVSDFATRTITFIAKFVEENIKKFMQD